jgi:DivIVA domain-containing protein
VTVFHLLILLIVLGAVAALAAGKVRGGMPEPTSTRPDVALPTEDVTPEDVDAVRFSVGFRGYRMDEVDDVLDRLGADIGARDREIEALRQQVSELSGGPELYQRPTAPMPPETPTAPPDVPSDASPEAPPEAPAPTDT